MANYPYDPNASLLGTYEARKEYIEALKAHEAKIKSPVVVPARAIKISDPVENTDGTFTMAWTILKEILSDERTFRSAVAAAYQEMVSKVASVILNENREKIEATLNFEDLRDALAAEMSRQFLAARLLGHETSVDRSAAQAKQMYTQNNNRLAGLGGAKTP
jgi:hypothetical protein